MQERPACQFCNRIRIIIFAIIIIGFLAVRPEFAFLWKLDTIEVFAWGLAVAVGLLVLWKAYHEFWKK